MYKLGGVAPKGAEPTAQVSRSASTIPNSPTASPTVTAKTAMANVASAPSAMVVPTATAVAAASAPIRTEPEGRRAEPVRPQDLAKARAAANSPPAESAGPNRVAIRPRKRTYVKVTVDNGK